MPSRLSAIFLDAGNTLIFPRVEELAGDLTVEGYPATAEDFHAAERAGKQKLDEWLWPQIRQGVVPRTIDPYYWREYLRALMERVHAPEAEHERLMARVADGFKEIQLWSRTLEDTPTILGALRAEGYFLGVISNSVGTMEEQLNRVGCDCFAIHGTPRSQQPRQSPLSSLKVKGPGDSTSRTVL